jgi:hypothetical protein
MGADAVDYRGVVPLEEAPDLLEAEGDFGMVTQAPPQFVSGVSYRLGSRPAADFIARDGAAATDLVEQLDEVPEVEDFEDGHDVAQKGSRSSSSRSYSCRSARSRR